MLQLGLHTTFRVYWIFSAYNVARSLIIVCRNHCRIDPGSRRLSSQRVSSNGRLSGVCHVYVSFHSKKVYNSGPPLLWRREYVDVSNVKLTLSLWVVIAKEVNKLWMCHTAGFKSIWAHYEPRSRPPQGRSYELSSTISTVLDRCQRPFKYPSAVNF